MTRLARLNDRYAAAAAVAVNGVELLAVADRPGAYLDAVIKEVTELLRQDGDALWGDLLAAARQLRWRLVTEPLPTPVNPDQREMAAALTRRATQLKPLVGTDAAAVLDRLADAASTVQTADSPVGDVLLRCLREVGFESCVVMTVSSRSAAAMTRWFTDFGLEVPIARAALRDGFDVVEHAYAVGSPRLFPPSTVTSPRARGLTFLFPSWESNRSLPRSPLAADAEGAIRPCSRIFLEGTEPVLMAPKPDVADDLVPAPVWPIHSAPTRPPRDDEVMARRVLLSGGLAIYLEVGGDHIRALDPAQPVGARVTYCNVSAVGRGIYLVLREGATERATLYARAVELLGERGSIAEASQRQWKDALKRQLNRVGRSNVVAALREAGVRRDEQAAVWTQPTVARPQDDHDFELLLRWLGLPIQPSFELATTLRRARSQASTDVREALEDALSATSMTELEARGLQRLDLELPGFSGIIATRVLAVSPTAKLISRSDVRIPEPDRSARWLE